MSLNKFVEPSVHPEVRAYIGSFVSALGGPDPLDDGRYRLGDEAGLCLRDIKQWFNTWDEKTNRQDVARALAESDFVNKDALEIISSWDESAGDAGIWHKLSLRCLELLVLLTWPVKVKDEQMTVHNHKNIPYLELVQVGYKKSILQHDSERILRTAVRLGLPAMAVPRRDRSAQDEGTIKLVLVFLANIARIAPPRNLPTDVDESDISRSALIEAFQKQDVFPLLLSVSSSMGTEFDAQDIHVLELLFHLLRGIDAEKLFMEEKQLANANTKELRGLMQKEKAMLSGYARHAPTRHNRFGTMVWVKRDDDRVSTVSGQDFLGDAQRSLIRMDKSKKWNKPRFRGKREEQSPEDEFDLPTTLNDRARKYLRSFVEDFLDSSFNPLFGHLRKAIERETERICDEHTKQYVYLVGWFLKAECARKRLGKDKTGTKFGGGADAESFELVATALEQQSFVLLNRFMQTKIDDKAWNDLNAGMKCFTQILLTVQEMADSSFGDDQEIAENIQNRIFYEEATHDRIIHILRSYKDQGFGYLDACTELAHVFLRMLEQYSKQNIDLQVRSRRRARRRKKAADGDGGADTQVEQQEDVQAAQKASTERKFDFYRFAAKFTTQACVDTFLSLAKYYNDLSVEQLKRAHRYFYRVAFKMELGLMLYRVDILQLFHRMIKGPAGLDPEMPSFKEWEELIKQIFRRAVKKLEQRPELLVEMLFSKIPSTMFYLEHGYDKELPKSIPKAPAELEVKPGIDKKDQVGVAVGILIDQSKSDALAWVKDVLGSAAEERKAWEDADSLRNAASPQPGTGNGDHLDEPVPSAESKPAMAPSIWIKPDSDERKKAMFKDNKLRLLMTLVGFVRIGDVDDVDASWIVPSALRAEELAESAKLIGDFEFAPPTYEEGKSAEDFVRSKAAAARRRRAEYDDDTEGSGPEDEDEDLLPAGAPTTRKADHDSGQPKKKRRLVQKREELDDEEKEKRRKAREKAEREKRRKIKSSLFIDSDDDLTDEERDRDFFAREAAQRKATQADVLKALTSSGLNSITSRKRKFPLPDKSAADKRSKTSLDAEDDSDAPRDDGLKNRSRDSLSDVDGDADVASDEEAERDKENRVAKQSSPVVLSDDESGSDENVAEKPLSLPHTNATEADRTKPGSRESATSNRNEVVNKAVGEESDDDDVPVRTLQRRTMRAGFVIDSDSE